MTNLMPRLQSRIAKRRNVIRQVEQDVAVLVTQNRTLREFGFPRDNITRVTLSDYVFEGRKIVKELADDQRLDKSLKGIVVERARLFGLHDI